MLLAGLGFLLLPLYLFKESVLYKIGTFLMVDQVSGKVDVVVTTSINEKVVNCYHSGECRKIIVGVSKAGRTWKGNNKKAGTEEDVREQAGRAGIDLKDLFVVFRPQSEIQYFSMLETLFLEKNIRSAVFYVGYYRGRRHRFYLDRYFKNKEIATYVQPANTGTDYMRNFDRWWENTMLDNLFMDEYLRIFYYYFNKVLWSSFV